jgi:hypothetical protein
VLFSRDRHRKLPWIAEGNYCPGPAPSMAARRKEMTERLKMPSSSSWQVVSQDLTRVNIGDIGDVFWPPGVEANRRRCEAARET